MVLQYPRRQKQLESLVQKLGLPTTAPIAWELLDRALTHSTVSTSANYEQLEFVGDAVIRLVAAEFLWEQYAHLPVGEFAAIRSILVSDRSLARLAALYGFENYLQAAKNILREQAAEEARLAESFEAVLGALYFSTHSFSLIRSWLDPHLHQLVGEILADPARQNYKAALQEWTQAHYKLLPEYRVQETQDANAANAADRFQAEVWLQGEYLGQGSGRSIKAAEQAAAQAAFLLVSQQKMKFG
ncbi:MAG: ribonuclease III [Leptolyngbyaceae cyanobacterium bins.302]|nr:ribonuclease III [Leptolyngbyaceae cyanobacterium bins.302]